MEDLWNNSVSRRNATLTGFTAILMWAFLALFSTAAKSIPPFQLAAMSFFVGGLLGAATWPFRPLAFKALQQQDWRLWALGISSLFGYHFVYFTAIRNAPPVEVSLIAYLWPLFLVVFSAFLPGEKLRLHHVVGVVLGLVGAFVVITRGQGFALSEGIKFGHILALPCAIIWSGYSILARRFGHVPTDVVTGFCLAASALSFLSHLAFEPTIWPATSLEWIAVLGLGLFPLGLAFYTWDYGLKHGDIMVLGALSYAAPLLSTLVLITFGFTQYHWSIAMACALITGGAMLAAKDMIFKNNV
jgi:drug/metabolite transporter (DMT)-like permease